MTTLEERLGAAGVEQVRIAWADLHGHWRGKTLVWPGPALQAALDEGIGMVSTVLLAHPAQYASARG